MFIISNFVFISYLKQIENKIPDTSHFINTQGFNRLTKIRFDARIKRQRKALRVKLKQLTPQIQEIKIEKNRKLQTFDSSYFLGKSYSENGGAQNYLIFQPIFKCFKFLANMSTITYRKA